MPDESWLAWQNLDGSEPVVQERDDGCGPATPHRSAVARRRRRLGRRPLRGDSRHVVGIRRLSGVHGIRLPWDGGRDNDVLRPVGDALRAIFRYGVDTIAAPYHLAHQHAEHTGELKNEEYSPNEEYFFDSLHSFFTPGRKELPSLPPRGLLGWHCTHPLLK